MRRVLLAIVMVLAIASPAHADVVDDFFNMHNHTRVSQGLNPLPLRDDANAAALVRAEAITESFEHDIDSITFMIADWNTIGENIGRGVIPSRLYQAFLDSPGHYDNIIDDRWESMGLGVVTVGGTIYITILFVSEKQPGGTIVRPAFQIGDVGGDTQYNTPERIRERVASIRLHRNLPVDSASDQVWIDRVTDGRATIGTARTRITARAYELGLG